MRVAATRVPLPRSHFFGRLCGCYRLEVRPAPRGRVRRQVRRATLAPHDALNPTQPHAADSNPALVADSALAGQTQPTREAELPKAGQRSKRARPRPSQRRARLCGRGAKPPPKGDRANAAVPPQQVPVRRGRARELCRRVTSSEPGPCRRAAPSREGQIIRVVVSATTKDIELVPNQVRGASASSCARRSNSAIVSTPLARTSSPVSERDERDGSTVPLAIGFLARRLTTAAPEESSEGHGQTQAEQLISYEAGAHH